MTDYKIGDEIEVIGNVCSHCYDMGQRLTIKLILKQTNHYEIYVNEGDAYVFTEDIIKINKINTKPGNFLITDPKYIISKNQLEEINLKTQTFPIKIKHKNTNNPIIIHTIDTTPYGPGIFRSDNETIDNKSGMLCIAEDKKGWPDESYGKKFETLQTSQDMFPIILNKF